MSQYKKTLSNIKASDQFKASTLQLLEKERRYKMKNSKKIALALTACIILAIGIVGFNNINRVDNTDEIASQINLLDRIDDSGEGISASVAVNIEGVITEVAEDGLSFKLDNGVWVEITDETVIGITGPTAAPKDEQFFEPTFRVGNMIAGFTTDEGNTVKAYAIYTNWNWDNPIR